MWMRKALIGGAAFAALTTAGAQSPLNFDLIPDLPDAPSVQVDLGPAMLGFAAAAARQNDPAVAAMIEGLNRVRLRVYEDLAEPKASAVGTFIDNASASLVSAGWESIVQVQDGTDRVRVFTRLDGQAIAGMTVLLVDSSDAVLIDIDGRIDPAQLGQLAGAMGFGGMVDSVLATGAAMQNAGTQNAGTQNAGTQNAGTQNAGTQNAAE